MSLKAQLEAIIYAAETPVTLDQMIDLVKESVASEGAADSTAIKSRVRLELEQLIVDYYSPEHGIEIRQVAGGYRMSTKPEQHEVVRTFAKSLKPPIRLSLPALETLAVIAYKQPVTVPEINDIRGVDSGGVISTLLDRKLVTTGGRKQVIGRPILYKTTKEFLMRFGLKDVNELPSMEEFEKLVSESFQAELIPAETALAEESVFSQAEAPKQMSDADDVKAVDEGSFTDETEEQESVDSVHSDSSATEKTEQEMIEPDSETFEKSAAPHEL